MERGCDSAGRRTDCRPDMEEPWLMDDRRALGRARLDGRNRNSGHM
jgi:hypothetical protein